jgi:hypothetical protein
VRSNKEIYNSKERQRMHLQTPMLRTNQQEQQELVRKVALPQDQGLSEVEYLNMQS